MDNDYYSEGIHSLAMRTIRYIPVHDLDARDSR